MDVELEGRSLETEASSGEVDMIPVRKTCGLAHEEPQKTAERQKWSN